MVRIEVGEIILQHDDEKMIKTWNVRWGIEGTTQNGMYKHTIGFYDIVKKGMTNRDFIFATGNGFIKEIMTKYDYNVDAINGVKLDEVKQDDITNENPFYWFIEGVLLGRKELEDVRNSGA